MFALRYMSKNMKGCLAILIFGLSSTACFGQTCEPNYGVDFEILTSAYAAGAEKFPTPAIERHDRSACKFGMKYTNDVTSYIESLFLNVYLQADQTGHQLIRAVKDCTHGLRGAIRSIDNNEVKNIGIEQGLISLTGQMNTFLNLVPGNVNMKFPGLEKIANVIREVERYPTRVITLLALVHIASFTLIGNRLLFALPDLPKDPVNVPLSVNENLPPADFFLNWAETADSVFLRLYGYITGMFLSGWNNARLYFNVVGTQIRNQVLNSVALTNYKIAVAEVLSHSDLIQRHCTNETWGSFQEVALGVAAISHNLNEALENYNTCII